MKKIIISLTIISLGFFISCSQNKKSEKNINTSSNNEVNKQAEDSILRLLTVFSEKGEYEKALQEVNNGIKLLGSTDELIHYKYNILKTMEKYDEALEVFDIIIERFGDTPNIIIDKVRLLMNLQRFDEALKIATKVDDKYEEKSPYLSLFIAQIYLSQENIESSLVWLKKSADRGFKEFDYLFTDTFKPLHDNEKFKSIILLMKKNVGIGIAAKDFSIIQVSGQTYNFSDDKGKVILLDFWATWCSPCVAEFPHLVKLYEKYKDKGFQIVSISADTNKESVKKLLAKHNVQWVVGYSGKGKKDETTLLYNVDGWPTYMIIDRNGSIRNIVGSGGENLDSMIAELI